MTTALLTAARAVARLVTRRAKPPQRPVRDEWIARGIREGRIRPAKGPMPPELLDFEPFETDMTVEQLLAEDRGG